jgi:predicted transcriptional regulator
MTGGVGVCYIASMVAKVLKDILTRVESWPERAQEEAAASLQAIEEELREPYELTEADKEAIDRGLEAARKGEIATDQEVEAIFTKYRQA